MESDSGSGKAIARKVNTADGIRPPTCMSQRDADFFELQLGFAKDLQVVVGIEADAVPGHERYRRHQVILDAGEVERVDDRVGDVDQRGDRAAAKGVRMTSGWLLISCGLRIRRSL
jgi:hypothetical protein